MCYPIADASAKKAKEWPVYITKRYLKMIIINNNNKLQFLLHDIKLHSKFVKIKTIDCARVYDM